MKFYKQLEQIIKEEESDLTPHEDWDTEDYKALHYYIKKGWIMSNATLEPYECEGDYDSYMINHYWKGEPLWTPPKKKKFKILTKEEKIRRDIMELHKKAEEENTKQHKKVLEEVKKGVDIKDATIKHLGQNFQDKIDSLMDNLVIPPECAKELSNAMGWSKKDNKN